MRKDKALSVFLAIEGIILEEMERIFQKRFKDIS